jgi:hypothetical protein
MQQLHRHRCSNTNNMTTFQVAAAAAAQATVQCCVKACYTSTHCRRDLRAPLPLLL